MTDPDPFCRRHVFCCANVRPLGHARGCCSDKGSTELRDYMKAKVKEMGTKDVRVNASGRLDRCELGPTMVIYPEGVWYRYESETDLGEILEIRVRDGGRFDRLMLHPSDRADKALAG